MTSPWESKIIGGIPFEKRTGRFAHLHAPQPEVVSLMHPNKIYRYCAGYILTNFTILSAASCIEPYEKEPFFDGVYVLIKNKRHDILSMESAPGYSESDKKKYNVGLITVSKIIQCFFSCMIFLIRDYF